MWRQFAFKYASPNNKVRKKQRYSVIPYSFEIFMHTPQKISVGNYI